MSTEKSHIAIKILKVFAWVTISVLLLLVVARLSLKTSWIHSIAKNQVTSLANQSLNGTLSIENIDGDLWNDFTVTGINITQPDTLLSLDSVRVRYDVWSLFNNTFKATDINLSGLKANIIETQDDQFNVQELVKTDDSEPSSFNIDLQNIVLKNSTVFVRSPSYLPDSTISLQQLSATAGFTSYDEISASLSSLSFMLNEGRLPEPISFSSSASYANEVITLDKLVIETGRSLLRTQAYASLQDSSLSADATALPLSLRDIQPYLDYELPEDELQLSLNVGGTFEALTLELRAEGDGFDDLLLISDFSLRETPTLNKLGLSGRNLDLAYFTNDSVDADIGDFQFTVEGNLNEQLESTDVTWGFSMNTVRYEDYLFEHFLGSGTLVKDKLLGDIQLGDGHGSIILNPEIDALWSDHPSWNLSAHASNIDLSWWLQDPSLQSEISFRSKVQGRGYQLSQEPWIFSIYPGSTTKRTDSSRDAITFADQPFSDFNLEGKITENLLEAAGFLQLIDSKVNFSASVADFLNEVPSYSYQIDAQKFNLDEITVIEDIQSSINMEIRGTGSHFDPEKIQMDAGLLIDSSFVNGAAFDLLDINASLDGNILTIRNGELISDVIEGSFSGRRNLADQTDPDNNLALDMQVKNLQPLAPFVGTNILQATGNISGNIVEIVENELLFDGNIQLNDIRYDTLFTANSIEGTTKISIREEYGYDLSLSISQPTFAEVMLQDLDFSAVGLASEDSLSGIFDLNINSEDAGSLSQSGNYKVDLQSLKTTLLWERFDFETPARTLSLQAPFELIYENSAIRTDTLMLRSPGGTFLNVAIPYADSLSQQVWIDGQDFDLGVIQEIIFDERFVDGILSGNIEVDRSPKSLSGSGSINISSLLYKETELERLALSFKLLSERLTANLSVTLNGDEAIAGHLDIPFVLKAQEDLDDSFFNEPVEGSLVINPVQISEFENLLQAFQITGTSGVLSFNGNLYGSAGRPDFEGRFNLQNPTLSGIKIDSAFASFEYHHLEKKLTGSTEINARGQKAASINAEIPITMDFRTFELIMPDETDLLTFNLVTDNFNISVFNDFLNKEYMNRLRGTLNADVNISGTTSNLIPKGSLQLSNGQVSVPIAGINLTGIRSELGFTNDGNILLNNFSMNSGSGNFSASGTIDLDGITPSNMDITARASRFRLANTSDYNLTIDLNSKLTGQPTRPQASGQLNVKNGFVYLQDFGERSVEAVELEGDDISSFSPYDSLAIDMRFVIERDFLIRNRRYLDMEIELTGELDAQKQTAGDLQLFGTLNAPRGYVRPLGKQFTVEDGRFTFSGPLAEPQLYIKTSFIPQAAQKQGNPIILYYIIEGNATDPEFRFESEPQMEQQDIICYTLFNKPCYALESWQQVVTGGSGSSPTDLLVGVLLDEFEALATQELGIDVVQIETSRSGSTTETSIKTGWYLNRRTFFAIVNQISGSTPKTMFILEYLLTQNLDLIITQGDDNQQGIDLRWHYDY